MLNWTDWIIIAIVSISSLVSLKRGFVKEALSLAVWSIAFFLSIGLSPKLAPVFTSYVESASLRQMAAFTAIFIMTLFTGSMISYFLSTLVKATGLTGTDRILGMVFGLARGLVIIMVLVIYLPKMIPVNQDVWWQQSGLIPYFQGFEESFRAIITSIYETALTYL